VRATLADEDLFTLDGTLRFNPPTSQHLLLGEINRNSQEREYQCHLSVSSASYAREVRRFSPFTCWIDAAFLHYVCVHGNVRAANGDLRAARA
jgi:hypothetical protein